MSSTKFYGSDTGRTTNGGGSVRMTIADGAAQGNGGTSLPCKMCYIIASAGTVRVKVGSACTATTGIAVPWLDAANHMWDVLQIPIDDVSKLYFFGTGAETIDVLYLT